MEANPKGQGYRSRKEVFGMPGVKVLPLEEPAAH
jgi:hypothetical protein